MSKDTTAKITNLNDLLLATHHAVKSFHNGTPWWRGHGVADWSLTPSAHRESLSETDMYLRFIQRARTRHSPCPEAADFSAWLFLMQHFGLPTRLLDWTESLFVATFFAVFNDQHYDTDGAIWALFPIGLNQTQLGQGKIFGARNPLVKPLIFSPFVGGKPKEAVVALISDEIDIRMLVQLSAFTVHGFPTPIEDLPQKENFLIKFTVPKEAKPSLRSALTLIGIRESCLFPDLEHLAKEIKSLKFRPYEKPGPSEEPSPSEKH